MFICHRSASGAVNKKAKQPKAKPKANEIKDFTNIRVIQRKMAYVTGLPLSLANEDVSSSSINLVAINPVLHSVIMKLLSYCDVLFL